MPKAMDFDKIRKRRQRTQTIKRLLILAAFMLVVLGIASLNKLLVEESVTTRISDLLGSFSGDGYPVPLPGGVIRDTSSVGNNLAVLNDTNLYIFSPKGKTLTSLQQMSDSSVLVTGHSKAMVYDIGKNKFSINTPTKQVFAKELEYGALGGDMNMAGDFVIVYASKQYMAEAKVYNRKLLEVGTWKFPDLVSHVAMSPSGGMMAVGSLDGMGGQLQSSVTFFSFDTQDPVGVFKAPPGELLYSILFLENDRVGIVTDGGFVVTDSLGGEKSRYSFGDRKLIAYEYQGHDMLLLMQQPDSKTQQLVLLDKDNLEKFSFSPEQKVNDIALARGAVYTLSKDGIRGYNTIPEEKSFLAMRNISNIQLAGNNLYYLTPDEICLLSNV